MKMVFNLFYLSLFISFVRKIVDKVKAPFNFSLHVEHLKRMPTSTLSMQTMYRYSGQVVSKKQKNFSTRRVLVAIACRPS